jgi:hypothetical protein
VPQFFKGDATELKYYNSGVEISNQLSGQKDLFYEDAYACFILGELLYDNDYAPLARAIPRAIFRESFATVFEAFLTAGSFESYLTVFRNIFGDDVEVEFVADNLTTPPDPLLGAGRLQINIVAAGFQLSDFVAREIENDAYVFYDIVDDEDDEIVFQTVKGFESQYELEQMLFEMVPAGIFTEITLTVGEE